MPLWHPGVGQIERAALAHHDLRQRSGQLLHRHQHRRSAGVGVLIEVEPLALSEWAQTNKVPFTTVATILDNATAQQLFVDEVRSTLGRLANKPNVGELRLLRRQLGIDTGDLTATGKLRRSRVAGIADVVVVRLG